MKSFGVWVKYRDKDNNINTDDNENNNININDNENNNVNINDNENNNVNTNDNENSNVNANDNENSNINTNDNENNNVNANDNENSNINTNDNENNNVNANDNKDNYVNLDLHINLWDIEKLKKENYKIYEKFNKYKYIEPFIDVGIMVENFINIEQIAFLIPFKIEKNNLINLKDTFSRECVTNLIFNENCEVVNDYNEFITYVKLEEKTILIYDFEDFDAEHSNINMVNIENNTLVKFEIFEMLKNNERLKEYSKLYIRFRIKSDKIKDELFRKIENADYFLESAFVATKVIDLKINKKRNIDIQCIKRLRKEKKSLNLLNLIKYIFLLWNQQLMMLK